MVHHVRRWLMWSWFSLAILATCADRLFVHLASAQEVSLPPLPVAIRLTNDQAVDQDDLCFWRDSDDPDKSVVIVSDKAANLIFVYDMSGNRLQALPVSHPGNIDLRDDFPWGEQRVPLIVVNDRMSEQLVCLTIDKQSRLLQRIDDGTLATGENYGCTLARLSGTDRFFCFITSKEHGVTQFELAKSPAGNITLAKRRHWPLGMSEGAVSDDEAGWVYVSVEAEGVYRLPLDPALDVAPQKVIAVDGVNLVGDVEGLTLWRDADRRAWLLVSDQGASRFRVHAIDQDYKLRCSIAIDEVQSTDGVDLLAQPCGPAFPHGVLGCHSDLDEGKTMRLINAQPLLDALRTQLDQPDRRSAE